MTTSGDMVVKDMQILRRAATDGKWSKVLEMFKEKRELRTAEITEMGDTILHVAVISKREKVVESMVEFLSGDKKQQPLTVDENGNEQKHVLEAKNKKHNTPLHLAASVGSVRMCKKISSGNDSLIIDGRNIAGETPLFLAARHGRKKAFLWLYYRYKEIHGDSSTNFAHCCIRDNGDTILHRAIVEGHIDVAIEIVHLYKDHMKEMMIRNMEGLSPLHLLAAVRLASKSSTSNGLIDNIGKRMGEKRTCAQLIDAVLQHPSDEDMSQMIPPQTEDNDKELKAGTRIIETPLMIAVKNGSVAMVDKILELFPSRIKDVNHEGKNILMLAIEYRQTDVCRFLFKQKWLGESLFDQVDKDGNNALHLAANLGSSSLNVGEQTWFDFVKDSSPCGLLERYNEKKETPEDVFGHSYVEITKSKLEWAAQASKACSLVSILVASVAFATRNTVPGGYNEEGYAILIKRPEFKQFVFYEFGALLLSILSTMCFLSILASSPSQSVRDWRCVSSALFFGMYCLFISILCLVISFCFSYSFLFQDDRDLQKALLSFLPGSLTMVGLLLVQLVRLFTPLISELSQKWGIPPAPSRKVTPPIQYYKRSSSQNKEKENITNSD